MEVFDNCRICLREINHEPIKMTRLLLRFLEKSLYLKSIGKPCPGNNVTKQNLCAPCFNKISDLQDFTEQCKDSDEFWKSQFEEFKEQPLEKQSTFEQPLLLPLVEDSNSLEADTTVTTTELKKTSCVQHDKNELNIHPGQIKIVQQNVMVNQETNMLISQISDDENEEIQTKENFNSIELSNWAQNTDDDNVTEIPENSDCDQNTKDFNEEIIEYEYHIEDEFEIKEIPSMAESANLDASSAVDYRLLAYEKIDTENSSDDTTTQDALEEQETTQNNFFLSTAIDDSGKVKTSYKCHTCDKSFNRIYDIESHSNIHKGVKPYTCNVCGKSFRQKNILTTHQALHFGKKVECAECGKKFARRSQLILHFRMHRDEKPFVCRTDGCDAAFRQRKQLIDHAFIHTDEKNFQCATCSKSFHTRKRLQDHLYKVHSQHRYRCEVCQKAFLKPHMLRHHMSTAHNIEIEDVSHLKTLVDELKVKRKSPKQTES